MKKILIVEDQYQEVKGSFEFANVAFFNGNLDFVVKSKSQDISFSSLEDFSAIIIDIQLANKSAMDGYGILKKIKKDHPMHLSKVIIMTGHSKIEDNLSAEGLEDINFPLLIKPINYNDVKNILQKNGI